MAEQVANAAPGDTAVDLSPPTQPLTRPSESGSGDWSALKGDLNEAPATEDGSADAPKSGSDDSVAVQPEAGVSLRPGVSSDSFETNLAGASARSSDRDAAFRHRRSSLTLKVGMVGDAACGKTSVMVRYCEGQFDEDYIMTLGVNFLERSVSLRRTDIVFSVWDLGGQSEFRAMLPLVTSDAAAMLFIFDLTRKATLMSIRDWYQQVRLLNRTAVPILVGNKYDLFVGLDPERQHQMVKKARKYARAMHAPLVFCSASHSIHVQRIFKLVLVQLFDLRPAFEPQRDPSLGPLCEW
ncbi:hypothetical protein CDCA_CDCA13G3600 [Cyanidium caldarium]|uniref:Septum-promoting GTP-binding protein 1 n=1 Tax=Cyanidium caldarium TaxID=2771 RepID=A0AAV9IZ11_CYACA|nr:hypothetical protein CDCA_CDCA13G3600 [Cyanidium caldarium]